MINVMHIISGFVLLAFLTAFNGCSNITLLRIAEIKVVEAKVDSLRVEIADLKGMLENEVAGQSKILRQVRADQKMGFSDVDRKMSALAGNVYESTERLSRIDEKTGQLSKQMEEQAKVDSLNSASQNSETEGIYNIALGDFTAGRYDVARQGFQDLIEQYPGASQAEISLYWVSECLYAEKMYKEAAASYKEYIKTYPEGEKLCVSLFKLGSVYHSVKKDKAAIMIWKKLISQCPDSQPAKAAQAKMDAM